MDASANKLISRKSGAVKGNNSETMTAMLSVVGVHVVVVVCVGCIGYNLVLVGV